MMKIISIHSHKGGAGKTTLAMMLAKAHARHGERVCAVDLDFIGSGFERLLDLPSPGRFLDDYLIADPGARPALAKMTVPYSDEELGNASIAFLPNYSGHDISSEDKTGQFPDHDRVRALAGREPGAGIVGRGLESLLAKLKEAGYQLAVLDCSPGLAYLTTTILRMAGEGGGGYTAIFVTTVNRAHFYGLLAELCYLADPKRLLFVPDRSILCVNRAPQSLGHTWQDMKALVELDAIHPEETKTLVGTFEHVCGDKPVANYCLIRENREMLHAADVGPRAGIVMPSRQAMRWSKTERCRDAFRSIHG